MRLGEKTTELLAYNGTFGTTLYSGAGLEMYFYCNYRDEFEYSDLRPNKRGRD